MRKPKATIRGLAVSAFLLLASAGYAQQDTSDHGAMDTVYISCTPPDFFDKDSIMVSFDLIFWTDAPAPDTDPCLSDEVIGAWNLALRINSSNPAASARVIVNDSPLGPVFNGTAVGYPNYWESRFNISVPRSGVLPATVIYGALWTMLDCFPNTGPPLSSGTHILAHILIVVKDTTTIQIDTTRTETVSLSFVKNDAVGYVPLWVQSHCLVSPVACLYKAGDANGDGKVDLSDLMFIVNRVYKGGPAPFFECQADLNADGIVTLLDIFVGVNYLFKGGPSPVKSWACCL